MRAILAMSLLSTSVDPETPRRFNAGFEGSVARADGNRPGLVERYGG